MKILSDLLVIHTSSLVTSLEKLNILSIIKDIFIVKVAKQK